LPLESNARLNALLRPVSANGPSKAPVGLNFRQALRIVDAMSPAILFVDELEKALSGVGGNGDSGVSTRLFGTLLTWMADHESDVFVVATANDISKLPPELTRAERLDGIFFLDLPGSLDRQTIWEMYLSSYGLPAKQPRPADEGWTGAEVRSCCRLAALLGVTLVEAAQNVVPVSRTASEAVDRLRSWATGRCLAADQAGIYSRQAPGAKGGRSVRRDPSVN
jgi:SpoVK/Ycf46/Vps4 family AAA+-type ATPase